ncbi:MAG: leucine-rich repeat domain-containing protein [Pseudomonadota bacterium]|nr:leucine-rich repeat domain-containing protein [Pseudomonadota bacterium]
MPIDAIQKDLLIHISLFLGSENRKRLGSTAKSFKNLDIEKALCSESVTVDYYLLKKIRCYPLNIATDRDAEQPRSAEKISAIRELVIAFNIAEHLTNDDLKKLADLGFIHEKTETINLEYCHPITDLHQIKDLSPLASCTALTKLDLSNRKGITNLSPLASCTALTDLNLLNCKGITNLSTLASCTALTSIGLGCNQITDLSPLASCTALTCLNLFNCKGITNLSPLASCTVLTNLDLKFCDQITDQILNTLPVLPELKALSLGYCTQITNLSPLASCTALTNLDLENCDRITDQILSTLPVSPELTSLNLSWCRQITDLSPIANCTELTNLDLSFCNLITDLRPLANHPTLSELIGPDGEEVDLTSLSNTQQPGP